MDFLQRDDCQTCTFWSGILGAIKQAILIADNEGRILFGNQAAAETLRCSLSDLLDRLFQNFITPEDLDIFFPNLLYLARNSRSFDGEIMLVRADSCRFIASLTMMPHREAQSRQNYLFLSFQDIHDRKQVEQTFARGHYPDLVKIADGIAHEIRNPLVGIGGFAQRLFKECKESSENRAYFDHMMKNIKKIEKLIQKVEFFAQLPKPSMGHSNLKDVLLRVAESYLPRMEQRKIDFLIDLGDIRLCMDPDLVARATAIFLENAVDAVPEGGRIAIRTQTEEGWAAIRIQDNGKGISPEDLPFIFNPFFSTKPEGAGIDLAIVKRIAESHQGKVEVTSTPGRETIFSLLIPVEKRRFVRMYRLEDSERRENSR
ncbi:MAG: PAS domain S-box protein [Desulfobacteraceae bacterium]|nr:PAS domain S-box protein [Desulfobacteraceae bacterium]